MIDAIIVGSGASAVHAAWAMLHHARRPAHVLMLDAGVHDDTYAPLIPDQTWSRLRHTDAHQHRYLLGDRFEGIGLGATRVGAQLTPPRAHIARHADAHNPGNLGAIGAMQSLARGGLAAGWGAGVARFGARDMAGWPIAPGDLAPHYEAVERRIGVCGERDDLAEPLGDHAGMMPPLAIDAGARAIMRRYGARRAALHAMGLRLGISRLAACSSALHDEHGGHRGPHRLDDLDFYADATRAVYRPQWTLETLERVSGFAYRRAALVRAFAAHGDGVRVVVRPLDGGPEEALHARRMVLCAGVFGTASIVLRSIGRPGDALPFVCNPYTYAPCLNLGALGEEWPDRRHSLSQLTGVWQGRPHPLDPTFPDAPPPVHVSLYSYRSLLTFKLMKEMPLGAPIARRVARTLMPLLTIAGIHHADAPAAGKRIGLVREGAGERLTVRYDQTDTERLLIERAEQGVLRALRRVGLVALKRIRPGHGASIHYAGTLPMCDDGPPLTCDPFGRLRGAPGVYIADGSVLPGLPAKGLTLTLMANADRIGAAVADDLATASEGAATGGVHA